MADKVHSFSQAGFPAPGVPELGSFQWPGPTALPGFGGYFAGFPAPGTTFLGPSTGAWGTQAPGQLKNINKPHQHPSSRSGLEQLPSAAEQHKTEYLPGGPGGGSAAVTMLPQHKASDTARGSQLYSSSFVSGQTGPGSLARRFPAAPARTAGTQPSSWASYSRFGSGLEASEGPGESGYGRADEKDEYLMRLLGAGKAVVRPSPVRLGGSFGGQPDTSGSDGSNLRGQKDGSTGTDKADSSPNGTNGSGQGLGGSGTYPAGSRGLRQSQQPLASDSQPSKASRGPAPDELKAKLGEKTFLHLRSTILQHQETFMGQMYELHRIAKRQQHLSVMCDKPDELRDEMQKLEQNQGKAPRQAPKQPTPPPAAVLPTKPKPAEQPLAAKADQLQTAPAQSSRPVFTPADLAQMYQQGVQAGMLQQQADQQAAPSGTKQYAANPAAAYAAAGAMAAQTAYYPDALPGYPSPFNPMGYGMTPAGFDPMAAWYAHHYGRFVAPVDQQNGAQGQLGGTNSNGVGGSEGRHAAVAPSALPTALRWWQDPQATFGPAVLPEVVTQAANRAARGNEATSRPVSETDPSTIRSAGPPKKRHRGNPEAGGGLEERTGQSCGASDAQRQQALRSPRPPTAPSSHTRHTSSHASGLQSGRSGGGVSAFRKLPQKQRSKKQRPAVAEPAESAGSENSKSSFDRGTRRDEHGGSTGAVQPALKSAAGILLSFSGV